MDNVNPLCLKCRKEMKVGKIIYGTHNNSQYARNQEWVCECGYTNETPYPNGYMPGESQSDWSNRCRPEDGEVNQCFGG